MRYSIVICMLLATVATSGRAAINPMQLNLLADPDPLEWDQIMQPLVSPTMTVSVDKVGGPTERVTGWQLFITIVPRVGESTGFIDFASVNQSAAGYIFNGVSGGLVVQSDPGLPYVFFAFDDTTTVNGVDITAGGAGNNLLDLTFASPVTARGKFDLVATPALGSTQWSAPPTAQVPPDPPDTGDRAFDNFPFGADEVLATVTVVPEPALTSAAAAMLVFTGRLTRRRTKRPVSRLRRR